MYPSAGPLAHVVCETKPRPCFENLLCPAWLQGHHSTSNDDPAPVLHSLTACSRKQPACSSEGIISSSAMPPANSPTVRFTGTLCLVDLIRHCADNAYRRHHQQALPLPVLTWINLPGLPARSQTLRRHYLRKLSRMPKMTMSASFARAFRRLHFHPKRESLRG